MKYFMISIQEHLTDQEYTLLILMSRKRQKEHKILNEIKYLYTKPGE